MQADKRSVKTDALETLGSIIDDKQKRDAIHIAVEPAIAGHQLRPGQDVGFSAGVASDIGEFVGIVDPFLKAPVKGGERFWLLVYPRKITSLRHVWSHPAFPETGAVPEARDLSAVELSRQWIESFASRIPLAYETVMSGADDWVASKKAGGWGEYLSFGGLLEGESVPADFWPHYEAVRGTHVAPDHRGSFFTCSC